MPALTSLLISDTAAAWRAGGFTVSEGDGGPAPLVRIGDIVIELVGDDAAHAEGRRGIVGWRLADLTAAAMETGAIDGVPTHTPTGIDLTSTSPDHPNGVSSIDHVVMFTPDLARTVDAMTAGGFEARRTRDVPGSEPARQQVFFWAGDTIVELVGPVEPTGDDDASLWGLALTCDDLDLTCQSLGDKATPPKTAVQPGRRIATLKTRDLGISTAVALMSPHPGSDRA